jgi:hypothetical protein
MTRSRAAKESPKVALFPFLAVLICTMGALILLLVIIARQAQLQVEEVDDAAEIAARRSQQELAAVEDHLKMLRMIEQEGHEELARRRAALESVESNVRQLADELVELERAQALLHQSLSASPSGEKQAELERRKKQIADLRARLDEARKAGLGQRESYAIIPYQGPNETRRQPIYIECRAEAIVLQPEGIVLTAKDFDGPMGPGNPLAAGVRAAEQYLSRDRRGGEADESQPYPLLLVRPDGIETYYVARAALKSWGSEFGYELIEQDWKLEFPASDPALLAVEQRAVEQGRERQRELAVAAASRAGGVLAGRSRPGSGDTFSIERSDANRAAAQPTFRVAPDGRIVRERSSQAGGPSRHGSSLRRYEDIVGEQSAAKSGASDTSTAPPTGNVAGVEGAGSGGMLAPGRPKRAAGQSQPSADGQRSDTAVATDQQRPRILPQQMFGRHDRPNVQSLADTHGKNWALPDASRGSLPVTRPIRLECSDDAIVLLSEYAGGPPPRSIPFGPSTATSVDALVTAIWERMETWGIAGKGLYWRPELHFETRAGGEARLNDLRVLLADSGLVIHEKALSTATMPGSQPQR